MKKILLSFIAFTVFLTGCDKQVYMDGTYSAEYDNYDSHKWKAYVEFTITEDVITDVNFDAVDVHGVIKSQDDAYQARMSGIVGIGPQDFMPQIESQIANAVIDPEFEGIDGVTGATGASTDATTLVAAALDAAIDGMSDNPILVTQPDPLAYENGTYKAEYDALDSHGWKAFLEVVIADNDVTSADYDYLDADGNRKSEDQGYQDRMSGVVGIGPMDYVPEINTALEEATVFPAFEEIDAVTGATHSTETANALMEEILDAAIEGEMSIVIEQPDPATDEAK